MKKILLFLFTCLFSLSALHSHELENLVTHYILSHYNADEATDDEKEIIDEIISLKQQLNRIYNYFITHQNDIEVQQHKSLFFQKHSFFYQKAEFEKTYNYLKKSLKAYCDTHEKDGKIEKPFLWEQVIPVSKFHLFRLDLKNNIGLRINFIISLQRYSTKLTLHRNDDLSYTALCDELISFNQGIIEFITKEIDQLNAYYFKITGKDYV